MASSSGDKRLMGGDDEGFCGGAESDRGWKGRGLGLEENGGG